MPLPNYDTEVKIFWEGIDEEFPEDPTTRSAQDNLSVTAPGAIIYPRTGAPGFDVLADRDTLINTINVIVRKETLNAIGNVFNEPIKVAFPSKLYENKSDMWNIESVIPWSDPKVRIQTYKHMALQCRTAFRVNIPATLANLSVRGKTLLVNGAVLEG